MKKILLLIAACAFFSYAWADTPKESSYQDRTLEAKELRGHRSSLSARAVPSSDWKTADAQKNMRLKSIRKADEDTSSPYGDWTFVYYDGYFEESYGINLSVQYTATDGGDGYVLFNPLMDPFFGFFLFYEPSTHLFTLESMYIGTEPETGFIISQEPFVANYLTQKIEYPQSISFYYDPSTGTIDLDPDSGIVWGAYSRTWSAGKYQYKYEGDFDGYYFETAFKGFGGAGGGDDSENWRDLGNALFMDGWVLPAFGINQLDPANWYEVPLQQSTVDENYYRLLDPYHLGPIADKNTSNTPGQIMFDVTDPDHVIFLTVDAGFANAGLQTSQFYCHNMIGWYLNMFPEYNLPYLLDKLKNSNCPYTTFKDNVVTLGYTVNDDGSIWNDANFGNQMMPDGGFDWDPVLGNKWSRNMSAAIYFPGYDFSGIGGIEAEEDCPAEFFTLQGVKVSNPEKGRLLIKRQGAKASKIIF